jgi:hypothetical protein
MLRAKMIDDTKMSHSYFLLVINSASSCHELHIAKSVSYITSQKGPVVEAKLKSLSIPAGWAPSQVSQSRLGNANLHTVLWGHAVPLEVPAWSEPRTCPNRTALRKPPGSLGAGVSLVQDLIQRGDAGGCNILLTTITFLQNYFVSLEHFLLYWAWAEYALHVLYIHTTWRVNFFKLFISNQNCIDSMSYELWASKETAKNRHTRETKGRTSMTRTSITKRN